MDAVQPAEPPLFVEEQFARQWWLWLLVINFALWVWVGFWIQIVQGRPAGSRPAPDWVWWLLAVVLGIGLPYLLYVARLRVEVRRDLLFLGFVTPLFPLLRVPIALEKIVSAEAVTYRPLRDYGGWGIRVGSKGLAYTVSGNRGVLLKMREGRDVLIGSNEPERFALALQQALSEAQRR